MAFAIEFHPKAWADLKAIDQQHQRRVVRFLRERVAPLENPRTLGEPLHGPLREFWKYRVGDFRVICDIQDRLLRVLVVRIGHRREVYDR